MMVEDGDVLIKFVKKVKEGKCGPVIKESLPYVRIKAERIDVDEEDSYYYSIS